LLCASAAVLLIVVLSSLLLLLQPRLIPFSLFDDVVRHSPTAALPDVQYVTLRLSRTLLLLLLLLLLDRTVLLPFS
jgi:hypothetical protein